MVVADAGDVGVEHGGIDAVVARDREGCVGARVVEVMPARAQHRAAIVLRRLTLIRGLFWKETHYHLARSLAGLLLPGRLRLLGLYFAFRYARLLWLHAHWDGDGKGGGPLLVPYYLVENAIELATALRGAARYRTLVL